MGRSSLSSSLLVTVSSIENQRIQSMRALMFANQLLLLQKTEFPSWNGNIYAVNETNGSLIWKQNLQELTVIGLNRTNGKLLWLTYLDHHPLALITMSGTYYKG
ncbi:hypothetical protein HN51_018008 [Arachis hypogaea]